MERQLEEFRYPMWAKDLRGPATVAYSLVITNGRIIRETRFLQMLRRSVALIQPVRPNTHGISAGNTGDALPFLSTLCWSPPGVDTVQSNFSACCHQCLDFRCDIVNIIARGSG